MLNRTGLIVRLTYGAVPTVFNCSTASHCCTDVNELTKNHAVSKDHSYGKTSELPDNATANTEANMDTETAVEQTSDTSADSSKEANTVITHPAASDHHYFMKHSQHFTTLQLQRKLDKSRALNVIYRKRQKMLLQKIRRLKRKVKSLSDKITTLKENCLVSENKAKCVNRKLPILVKLA